MLVAILMLIANLKFNDVKLAYMKLAIEKMLSSPILI